MPLPNVSENDPHVAAHNAERSLINGIQNLSDSLFRSNLTSFVEDIAPGGGGSAETLVNAPALLSWYNKSSNNQTLKVVAVGDSITEGTMAVSWNRTWPYQLQSKLRSNLGHGGGVGYIAAHGTDGAAIPGLPLTRSGGVYEGWFGGLGGHSLQVGHNTTDHVTYDSQVFTKIRVYYRKALYAGSLAVQIDGEQVAILNCNAQTTAEESSGNYWTSLTYAPAGRVVRVVPLNAPNFAGVLEGVEFINQDDATGVRVYNAGHYGATAVRYAQSVGPFQAISEADPDVVVINLGTNDLVVSTVSEYLNAMDSIISKIDSDVPILLLAPWMRGDEVDKPGQREKWEAMNDGLRARATGRVAFFDLQRQWPQLASDGSTSAGLMSDNPPIHPSDLGMTALADIVYDILLPDSSGTPTNDVNKLDKTATLTAQPSAPQFRRDFNFVMSTALPNIWEIAINGVLRSWKNEWGALRGRIPYNNYNDALVRAIIEPGDTVQETGNAFEVIDRRKPAGDGRQSWGVRWSDGRTVQNGVLMIPVYYHEIPEDPLPADLPDPCLVVVVPSGGVG